MYKNSNSFVYILVINFLFFPNNSIRMCPIKLKIDMLHHMTKTFRNTVFLISVNVPLRWLAWLI